MPPAVMSVIFEGISAASGLIVTPFLRTQSHTIGFLIKGHVIEEPEVLRP